MDWPLSAFLLGRYIRDGQIIFTYSLIIAGCMRLIKDLDAPKTVIVKPIPYPIPIKGGISVAEQAKADELRKDHGFQSLDPLIKSIASKTAEKNGNDPVKIATQLIELRKIRADIRVFDPVEDYRGYFLIHCEEEFTQFENSLRSKIIDRKEASIGAYLMLKRISKNDIPKTDDFDPSKLTLEHLLDPDFIPKEVLEELYYLYLVENSDRDINDFLNDAREFSVKHDKQNQEENAKAENSQAKVEESTEVVAGKS